MQLIAYGKGRRWRLPLTRKTFLVMKMVTLILFLSCMVAGANGLAQNITISLKNAPLEKVFKEVERQSQYRFVYTKEQLELSPPVSLEMHNKPITEILNAIFKDQPIQYTLDGKYVLVSKSVQILTNTVVFHNVKGKVTDEKGETLGGVSINVKGTGIVTTTDENGMFSFTGIDPDVTLIFSGAELETVELSLSGKTTLQVTLLHKIGKLDETIVIGYGTTTRRLSTGSISKVSANEIERQPVSNPLIALSGRVPGLLLTQANGMPGSNVRILIRGENSLRQGTEPLIIVDGIPFMLNSGRLTDINSTGNQSLFNTINPSDVESIEILKDASATAIYGSQGANGVIIITTKKGKSGKTKATFNAYYGFKKVTRTMSLLNTAEYLSMRNEAFKNDGIIPSASNAPDLVNWDPLKYTNWKNQLIGGTTSSRNLNLSISGGTSNTQFLFSGNFYSETYLFPESVPAVRGTGRLSVNHSSNDQRFKVTMITSFGADIKKQSLGDMTSFIFLPPNAPDMKDSAGNLKWSPGIENPYANALRKNNNQTYSFFGGVNSIYKLSNAISLKLNVGYDKVDATENALVPIRSLRPDPTATGTAYKSNGLIQGWIVEPQLTLGKSIGKGQLDVIIGGSLQGRNQTSVSIIGSGYTNDDFLSSFSAATTLSVNNAESRYKYIAGFGRVDYNYNRKYIGTLSIRRDGSSRFGPANRFSGFGSLGGAWIFTEEKLFRNKKEILSFGKIKASFGTTGNDQIGDYQYLDGWASNSNYQYGTGAGFLPQKLFNPNLQWEKTRKFQFGIDLQFLNNHISVNVDYYRNLSNNQLVYYALPATTGFTTVLRNLDASFENKGVEVLLSAKLISKNSFNWEASINATFPKNKLLKYPNLENSSDAATYIVGEPLRIVQRYQLLGVDPQSGLYTFVDKDGDGVILPLNDYERIGFNGQQYFGGIENNLSYKSWTIDLLFQFVKQTGNNYLTSLISPPGNLFNQPVSVLQRWQKPGDQTEIQKFTSTVTPAYTAFSNYLNSSAVLTNASFFRLKNAALAWNAPAQIITRMKIDRLKLYLQCQDFLTFTKYRGADPETRSVQTLPLLKTIAFGLQITF